MRKFSTFVTGTLILCCCLLCPPIQLLAQQQMPPVQPPADPDGQMHPSRTPQNPAPSPSNEPAMQERHYTGPHQRRNRRGRLGS